MRNASLEVDEVRNMAKGYLKGFVNRLLNVLARNIVGAYTVRPAIHRIRGVKINGTVWIGAGVYIDDEYPEWIEIGNNVMLGVGCMLFAHFRPKGEKQGIVIEDDAFIGPGAIITQNVRIGKGVVVAAGSVVSKDVPPYTFVGGVPARPIGKVRHPLGIVGDPEKFSATLVRLESSKEETDNYDSLAK